MKARAPTCLFSFLFLVLVSTWVLPSLADAPASPSPRNVIEHFVEPARATADLTLLPEPTTRYSKEGDAVTQAFGLVHGADVSYAAMGLPSGLQLDPATGIVNGTIGKTAAGQYVVQMRAQQATRVETITFTWVVLDVTLPQIASPGVQVSTGGDTIALPLSASDADGETLTFRAYGLPPGLTLDPATGAITGKLADYSVRTTYGVTVTVSDHDTTGGTVFTWIVLPNR